MAVYDTIGTRYSATRRTDPRIAALVWKELEGCARVVNVGAGTGNYEIPDRVAVAVEPARTMVRQRPTGYPPAVQAIAEQLPFRDGEFDAAMSILSTHHWRDRPAGLAEMRRVARKVVTVLTHDPAAAADAWLIGDYFPGAMAVDRPLLDFEGTCRSLKAKRVTPVPVPWDCVDGFLLAFWRRPEAYLDPAVRSGMSVFTRMPDAEVDNGLARLRADLDSGAWGRRHAELLRMTELDLGYRLVTWLAD